MGAYSGALVRSAHFAFRPPVPGIDPRHEHPDPQPDPFSPAPETPEGQEGDVWQATEETPYTDLQMPAFTHDADLIPPVPSNVHRYEADAAWQDGWLSNHGQERFRPDTYPVYKHADQGHHIAYVQGREPQNGGATVPDDMAYLVMGRNSYDQTNAPNPDVYGAEEGGGARYRLGTRIENWGLYNYWLQQGQDAELRAYTGLEPAFPVDKPNVEDPAPYTPPSSGTARWQLPAFVDPSLFALPSETAMTDYATATEPYEPPAEFDDGGRM